MYVAFNVSPPDSYLVGPVKTTHTMMSIPKIKLIYASRDIIPANQPFNFFLLNQIKPIAKNNKIIPAKDMYILSIERLMKIFTSNL